MSYYMGYTGLRMGGLLLECQWYVGLSGIQGTSSDDSDTCIQQFLFDGISEPTEISSIINIIMYMYVLNNADSKETFSHYTWLTIEFSQSR